MLRSLLSHQGGGAFKKTYELINLGACKFSFISKLHIFQCMAKISCVEFQRFPLKFHTKYLTHTLKEKIVIQYWNFRSFHDYELINVFETPHYVLSCCTNHIIQRFDWIQSYKFLHIISSHNSDKVNKLFHAVGGQFEHAEGVTAICLIIIQYGNTVFMTAFHGMCQM